MAPSVELAVPTSGQAVHSPIAIGFRETREVPELRGLTFPVLAEVHRSSLPKTGPSASGDSLTPCTEKG